MRRGALWLVAFLAAAPVQAADTIVGTLTVKGRTFPLQNVAASVQKDAEGQAWLVVLVSDVPVAEADRAPARLAALAADGKVRAVRVVWMEGYDTVRAAPYVGGLAQSGRQAAEHPTLNLNRYDEQRFEGDVKSKMLGQDWFFEAHVKTTLVHRGMFELEAEADEVADDEPPANAARSDDPREKKIALGKRGYEFNGEHFAHAVQEADVEAVKLFLAAGMAPNTPETPDRQPLGLAVDGCAYQHEAEALEMVKVLLGAGAKVEAGARDGITPLLRAAQYCAGTEILKVLIAAGANVNTKAPGGATPLMFAKVFNRKEAEDLLRRAGARD